MLVNTFLAATPECWLFVIFGVAYGAGSLLYIMMQFDFEYTHRNDRDWHYIIWLIMLPALLGVNQRYHPHHSLIRLFYGSLLVLMVFAWQPLFWYGYPFFQKPTQMHQISTIDEIVHNEYRLVGTPEVKSLLSHDTRVIRKSSFNFDVHQNFQLLLIVFSSF